MHRYRNASLAEKKGTKLKSIELVETAPLIEKPRKYAVILLNDDYTPMEFVVDVLKFFFHLPESIAIQVMLQVHTLGKGVCGVFTRDIAETKVALVNAYARDWQHPLLCIMRPE